MNEKPQTSRATSNTSNSNINGETPKWNESISSEEEDIKCIRKIHIETVNEEMKVRSSQEE